MIRKLETLYYAQNIKNYQEHNLVKSTIDDWFLNSCGIITFRD
ncbi:hypothetical protein [Borreliella carolinensis]|uniref:Uncharacterized protein n=1 Tax=Borreliella carolinensis TaxID=478174 RepID=A0ACD5GKQ9_9SPIR